MHCGYLSLCHNCNTNCKNVSLTITETSTTLSRTSTPRKFFLLPLFLSPRRHGEVAGPLPPCARFGGSERQINLNSTVEFLHDGTTRSFHRGVPHDAVTPMRPGNVRQRCRPLPRRWSLLSPYGVVRLVLHLLLGPCGKLLAPWSAVRGVHLAGRVVHHRCQGRSDRLLLVSPPRARSSLPATLSSSHHGLPAKLSHENLQHA